MLAGNFIHLLCVSLKTVNLFAGVSTFLLTKLMPVSLEPLNCQSLYLLIKKEHPREKRKEGGDNIYWTGMYAPVVNIY